MKNLIVIIFLILVNSNGVIAQFIDDFSDGDFAINPAWTGNTSKFEVLNEDSLHLIDVQANTAYLSTESTAISDAVWEFYVNLDFNPSSSNFCNIYLCSTNQDLTGNLNGYYVKIGGSDDEVSLFRQDGFSELKIIDGTNDFTNKPTIQIHVRVSRDAIGNWTLSHTDNTSSNEIIEGQIFDATYTNSSFFGLKAVYTITRANKFYFDNFIVSGNVIKDETPPTLESVGVSSINSLMLTFSENLELSSVANTSNYIVNNEINNPSSALLDLADHNVVHLTFAKDFQNGFKNTIAVEGIKDLAANIIVPSQSEFIYFKFEEAIFGDIIFTEIFADISPSVGLPNAEYLEIFNRSNKVFNLEGWIISDEVSNTNISQFFLTPGNYLLICDSSDLKEFQMVDNKVGVVSFPTLNDNGDRLKIRSLNIQSIDSVNYDRSWYNNTQKDDGGFSLELINPFSICQGSFNWAASSDPAGGTPGLQNANFNIDPDIVGPILQDVVALSEHSLRLIFNEPLERASVITANYDIQPFLQIEKVELGNVNNEVLIFLADPTQTRILYEIKIDLLRDCSTNIIQTENANAQFVLPELASVEDVLVSEILFNPRSGGVDFVEVYNNSDKYINLRNWHLANLGLGDSIDQIRKVVFDDLILSPSEYRVFTENDLILKSEYPKGVVEQFIVTDLPTYPDDEGTVILLTPFDSIMDSFHYSEELHFPIIRDNQGVSLERISFNYPSNENDNWKSAATTENYATPGYKNSQALDNQPSSGEVAIRPKTFSPNNDGIDDFAQINYSFPKPGNVANVIVYDVNGRLVKELTNNTLLGPDGFFVWDGTDNNNRKARVGYYIIIFKIFNNSGEEGLFKKTVVLATDL